MAKSKTKAKTKTKPVDEDEELQVKAEEEEVAVEEAEEETAVDETDVADDDAEPVTADDEPVAADDDDKGDDDDGESPPPRPAAPKAKITRTAIVLILLNWIAAPAFLTFAYMDSVTRTQYSYLTLRNYIQVWGLPLASEEASPSAANETHSRLRLTSAQLEAAFKDRTRKSYQNFQPYEETLDNPVGFRLRPSDMQNEYLKKDVFQGVPDPVATLDEAMKKLEEALPVDIQRAAEEVVAKHKDEKDDAKKRAVIAKILLPIAWDVQQVKKLDDKLEKTKGADLDKLLDEAAQRRMYYDILAPLNIYKPGEISDFKDYKVEKLSSDEYDLNQVKKFMKDRLVAAYAATYDPDVHLGKDWPNGKDRDSIEKRHHIGFVLFALSQVSVPTLDRKLYPKGVERAQVISGMLEFTNASIYYVRAVRFLEDRIIAAIKADRDGLVVLKDKDKQSTPGFIADYNREVDTLVKAVEHIDTDMKRLALLKTKRDELQKNYDHRVEQHNKTLDQLLKARKQTEKFAQDLRKLQDQLHRALVDLSDAGEVNFRLYEEIRDIELDYLRKKGGK